jgi:DNA-binding MarR family transcriptional regulator
MAREKRSKDVLLQALALEMREITALGVLHSEAMARILGVHSTDLECLDLLTIKGPLTAGELGTATHLTTGAITGVIDRLERRGFVRRERDQVDRRKVIVTLSPDALSELTPVSEPMVRHVLNALMPYSRDDLALIIEALGKTREAAKAAMAELSSRPPHPTNKPPT